MIDLAIVGVTTVDGSGVAPCSADIGIDDGRIVSIGVVDQRARRTIRADDLIVCPGFVDLHTHYDAQLWWDPYATPSLHHGVTTVIGGNCGFSLAPLAAADADYTRRMLSPVEGMPLEALQAAVPWQWETFDEFLGGLEGGSPSMSASWSGTAPFVVS